MKEVPVGTGTHSLPKLSCRHLAAVAAVLRGEPVGMPLASRSIFIAVPAKLRGGTLLRFWRRSRAITRMVLLERKEPIIAKLTGLKFLCPPMLCKGWSAIKGSGFNYFVLFVTQQKGRPSLAALQFAQTITPLFPLFVPVGVPPDVGV